MKRSLCDIELATANEACASFSSKSICLVAVFDGGCNRRPMALRAQHRCGKPFVCVQLLLFLSIELGDCLYSKLKI